LQKKLLKRRGGRLGIERVSTKLEEEEVIKKGEGGGMVSQKLEKIVYRGGSIAGHSERNQQHNGKGER